MNLGENTWNKTESKRCIEQQNRFYLFMQNITMLHDPMKRKIFDIKNAEDFL